MQSIIGPTNVDLTTDWHKNQYTTLHAFHPKRASETNKLLKAFGRGSFFVVSGFKLGVFKATINGKDSCIARLTPGVLVQDFVVIDFVQPQKDYKNPNYLYIKLFDESNVPLPRQVFKLGSRYQYGTIGDGINAVPTYSTILSLRNDQDRKNFRTLYSFTLTEQYGANGIIDIPNIQVEDFRFPPNDTDPTDEIDPYKPVITLQDSNNIIDKDDTEYDYTKLISRSESLKWSMIF